MPAAAPNIVVDSNVFVSAVFWHGSARQVLAAIARRRAFALWTPALLEEYADACADTARRAGKTQQWEPWLNWYRHAGILVLDPLLSKPVSRDPDDDVFVAAAVSGGARYLVTRDKDLLSLGKPFGVEIIEDRAFLRRLKP